jgi:putative hydrolase
MSSDNPFGDFGGGMGGFMPNMFADVMKLMRSQDPTQFDLIAQLALSIAVDPDEGNVDPKVRIATEELTRIAELHVADVTGMTITPTGHPVIVETLSRGPWVQRSLLHWKTLLGEIVQAQGTESAPPASNEVDLIDEDEGVQMAKMMEGWMATLAPTLVAMQIGSAIGHLGTRALGQYDLLLPADFSDGLGVIAQNRRAFAQDWSLPEDDLSLWFSVNDITLHAVLARTHVSQRLGQLITTHAKSLRIDPITLQQQLGSMASGIPTNMTDLAALLGENSSLSESSVDADHQAAAELKTLVTVIRGYADWVTKTVAERSIGARSAINEAVARSRRERSEPEKASDAIVGVEHTTELYEQGRRFIDGVIERNGERELTRLWVVERNIPTPAELDAPGLWLERINLPDQD